MPSIGTQSNSITNLKSTVLESGKLHNPNKFHAEVSGPQGEMINPYVTDVVLPGRGVKTQQEFLWGLERNVPIGRSYSNDDFLITFALRETFYERSFFENWISTIFNRDSGFSGNSTDPFIRAIPLQFTRPDTTSSYRRYTQEGCHVIVKPLKSDGTQAAKITLIEPYPSAILPLTLSSASQNEFSRIQVKFGYREYIYETI